MIARMAGLYAVTPDLEDTDALCLKVAAALAGGATVVQYRNKTASPGLKRAQALRLRAVCRRYGVPLVVNDDAALAVDIGAEGLHVGREDGPVREVRARIGPDMALGVSCYDSLALADEAITAGADHIAFGAAFPSRVKPNAVHASLELYAEARRRFRAPIVAIGGITLDNAPRLLAAGVDAIAIISALFDAPDVEQAAASFTALFSQTV